MKKLIAAVLVLFALPAWATHEEIIRVQAAGDVATTMDKLEAAVTEAGATVFARIDHAGGAAEVGLELAPSQVLIFGNPKLGTPAMQDDPLAGLFLPLKVLVFEDADGQVWLVYETPKEVLDDMTGFSEDAEHIKKMTGALDKLTAKAAK